jgi:hypothetical protein
MADIESNIDLIFRNGLRDLEVLPPAGTWNNIRPVVRKKQRSYLLLRIAAVALLLLSVGFILGLLTRKITDGLGTAVLSLNQEVMPEGRYIDIPSTEKIPFQPVIKYPAGKNVPEKETIANTSVPAYVDISLLDPGRSSGSNLLSDNSRNLFPYMQKDFVNSIDGRNLNLGEKPEPKLLPQPENQSMKRWSITAMAAPTYFMAFTSKSNEYSKRLLDAEKSLVSYSGGFSFSYKLNRKLSIQSGIYYSSVGQEISGINSYAGFGKFVTTKSSRNFEVLTSSGNIYPVNGDIYLSDRNLTDRVLTLYTLDVFDPDKSGLQYLNSSLFQDFRYLEMPIMMRYKLIDRKFDLNLVGGISYNLLVNNSVFTYVNGDKFNIAYTEGLNPSAFSSSFGMGMEYNLSEKFSFNLEPTFRYYLSPLGEQIWTDIHPYSFGIFTGISYKF